MKLFVRIIHFITGRESANGDVNIVDKVEDGKQTGIVESEKYKSISEENLQLDKSEQNARTLPPATISDAAKTTMVQEVNNGHDGADERMLGAEDSNKLAERHEEVKFIKGDHQNGDAKIDIGAMHAKTFTGMTKEELMKYANDPFWVRLRWIFFVTFWIIWVAMLVGAILIIINSPKCAAPEPLPWYKRGLHAKFGAVDAATPEDVQAANKLEASGAIYELPAALTYNVREANVEAKIKQIVEQYKGTNVQVILDITPNIVPKDSHLLKDALENEDKRSAFVWVQKNAGEPTNWKKVGGNSTAWEKIGDSYVLSQFADDTYDLRMNDTIVRREFKNVLTHLLDLGVRGFRLKNTAFFMIATDLENETIETVPKDKSATLDDYGFYNHEQTTYQMGLGDVLFEYLSIVKNISSDAFLSVADDMVKPQSYKTLNGDGPLGIDLPMYGRFPKILSSREEIHLQGELDRTIDACGADCWLQWNLGDVYHDTPADPSALALFMSMLPGVPVVPVDAIMYENVTAHTYKHIEQLRLSPSYMHGEFALYDAPELIAYSRIKTGNPGYFVILNPSANSHTGNFTNLHDLPEKMTVVYVSDNLSNSTTIQIKAKVDVPSLELPPYSTVILTYVPNNN